MHGPPKFDESKGDRRSDTPLTLNLVPRERTHESLGAGSSSGPVRLTPGPCATLPTDLTEDPLVARIVPSMYNGHVIMYTTNKVMTVKERNSLIGTALPELEAAPGDSQVRSRGARLSDSEGSVRRSPFDSSNFGGPGMPSKSLREGFLQRS